ncbi:hypothetical protein GTZ99_06875 [Novosphingobium sp. FSY-8]|uniref:Uncharacterized protein n=1 Tax=Novosphingobium ovatum TaxID=1908523 RepID=A0ABW9XCM5_9SPHN|nr:hypothetical protein [Novosphingobium ovatum]NBC36280.1 hypothetical protein [Novosphingobium ovatum]
MRKMLCLAGMVMMAVPAHAQDAPALPIHAELFSWGQKIEVWDIAPDGKVQVWQDRAAPGKPSAPVTATGWLNASGVAEVAMRSYILRARAGTPVDCGPPIHDVPAGSLRWGEGADAPRLSFGFGCTSDAAKALNSDISALFGIVHKTAPLAP